jgi:hypothetical protein
MIIYDGCDEAIVGFIEDGRKRVVYDYVKLVQVFEGQGMDHEGAVEWIDFNILGAHLGDHTPAILFPGGRAMIDAMADAMADVADEYDPEEDT